MNELRLRELTLPARGTWGPGFTQGWSDPRVRAQPLSCLKRDGQGRKDGEWFGRAAYILRPKRAQNPDKRTHSRRGRRRGM